MEEIKTFFPGSRADYQNDSPQFWRIQIAYPKNHWTLPKRGVWMCFSQGSFGSRLPPVT